MTTFVKGMNKNNNITTSFAKYSLLVVVLFVVVQYVFAVSGIRSPVQAMIKPSRHLQILQDFQILNHQ